MTATDRLFDAGVNLTDKSFVGDFAEILRRAQQAGVTGIMNIASNVEESMTSLGFVNDEILPIYTTAGVHPHHAKDVQTGWVSELQELLNHPKVKAIGETGLDFNRNFSSPEQQIKVFEQQLELGVTQYMPLYLHEREAHEALYQRLKSHRDDIAPSLLHCFTGDQKSLYRYLDLDLYIGITGWVCDERRGLDVLKLVKDIPTDRLLIETDAPYLLPRTLRPKPKSRRNEPCYVAEVCQQIAKRLGVDPKQLAQQTTDNAHRLFQL